MKKSLWTAALLATLLQLAGLLCGSYGVLRESFKDLAQVRGYGEGRYGEGIYGGGQTGIQEVLIRVGTKIGLLSVDRTLTITDRRANAAWAIAGVLVAVIGTITDLVLKFSCR